MLKSLITCTLAMATFLVKANDRGLTKGITVGDGTVTVGVYDNAAGAPASSKNKKKYYRKSRTASKSKKFHTYRPTHSSKAHKRSKPHLSLAANQSAFSVKSKTYIAPELTPEEITTSDHFKRNKGNLPWPVDNGRITLPFGRYPISTSKGIIIGDNPGLTIETEAGTPVQAVFDGEVQKIFDIDGDSAVYLRHGKYFTTYYKLVSINVSQGQKVKPGDTIGIAASNDAGKGEIDFVLQDANRNLDPKEWLNRNKKQ